MEKTAYCLLFPPADFGTSLGGGGGRLPRRGGAFGKQPRDGNCGNCPDASCTVLCIPRRVIRYPIPASHKSVSSGVKKGCLNGGFI